MLPCECRVRTPRARRGGPGVGRCGSASHRRARTLSALRRAGRLANRPRVRRIGAEKRTVAPARSRRLGSAGDPDPTVPAVPGPRRRSRMMRPRFAGARRNAVRAASGVDGSSMSASCRQLYPDSIGPTASHQWRGVNSLGAGSTVSRVLRAQRRRSFSRQKSYRTRNRSSLPTSGAPTNSRCRLLRMLFAVSDTWVLGWKGSR